MRIAIIGASGFVGLRATEMLRSRAGAEIRPIVRSASSLAVLARMRLDWRICDLLDWQALAGALAECDACVHVAIGDAAQIAQMSKAVYLACDRAKVKRLVWLSSASVHGQNPSLGTDENTPLHTRHAMDYNNGKVRAEWILNRLAEDGRVNVVKLRPAVVFGPRSRWIFDTAEALLECRAAWINSGKALCNTIYVDNLVEAIHLAISTPEAAGQSFLVGDAEKVTWREFLLPIAKLLGYADEAFTNLDPVQLRPVRSNRLKALTVSPYYTQTMRFVPDRAKRLVKSAARAWPNPVAPGNPWMIPRAPAPALTEEMNLLQQCEWQLSSEKARTILHYQPSVCFEDGMRRSLQWLQSVLPEAVISREARQTGN